MNAEALIDLYLETTTTNDLGTPKHRTVRQKRGTRKAQRTKLRRAG